VRGANIRSAKTANDLRAGGHWLPARFSLGFVILSAAIVAPPTPFASAVAAESFVAQGGEAIADFYEARDGRPLWFSTDGDARAADRLIDLLLSSEADGLDPGRYEAEQLALTVRLAQGGSPEAIEEADRRLSRAFVDYVRDLKRAPKVDIVWVDSELKPKPPTPIGVLQEAAKAPSLEAYVAGMGWMHPVYAGLRRAIANGKGTSGDRPILALNRERARALPSGSGRYILVNATAATLTAYDDGKIVDSMRVVVGKPKNPTPMMAGYIRFTSLNPYWNVPPDLTAERIAPNVVKEGLSYLYEKGYQVLSDWGGNPSIVDPATIDWQAVADGRVPIRVRQLPGPANSMGQMKFMFPNPQGIYLHDTPDKELLTEASRMFSGGCVRLEDAPRLAEWMHGEPLRASSNAPELRVDLPKPIPVYITYLTVMPSGNELATFPDVYGRDRSEMAAIAGNFFAR
jgi:L,D-transpeptidase YcbB